MGAKNASFWPAARGHACKVKLPNTYLNIIIIMTIDDDQQFCKKRLLR